MALPNTFQINTTQNMPFPPETLATLPKQQRLLEKALLITKYRCRSIGALSDVSGLTPEQVVEYCETSAHIAREPLDD